MAQNPFGGPAAPATAEPQIGASSAGFWHGIGIFIARFPAPSGREVGRIGG